MLYGMDRELKALLDRLRERAAERRDRAKASAEAEFLADIQSIDRLALLGDDPRADQAASPLVVPEKPEAPARLKPPEPEANSAGGRKNGPTSEVRKLINATSGEFSISSVATELGHARGLPGDAPKAPIYSAFNKLVRNGEIQRVMGADGTPSTNYRILKLKHRDG